MKTGTVAHVTRLPYLSEGRSAGTLLGGPASTRQASRRTALVALLNALTHYHGASYLTVSPSHHFPGVVAVVFRKGTPTKVRKGYTAAVAALISPTVTMENQKQALVLSVGF